MTDDDVRNTMQFILQQQAQLTVTVGRLSETVDRLGIKVDRTADGVNALLAIAEIHEREIEALKDSAAANREAIAANTEAGRATDERLNALINVVEQMISERRNGGDRPA
jgi:ABC-type transporter Mla subunit MlaD